jgi:hypothetical protein
MLLLLHTAIKLKKNQGGKKLGGMPTRITISIVKTTGSAEVLKRIHTFG